jgi:signal recognition particle receptor subunit beta
MGHPETIYDYQTLSFRIEVKLESVIHPGHRRFMMVFDMLKKGFDLQIAIPAVVVLRAPIQAPSSTP